MIERKVLGRGLQSLIPAFSPPASSEVEQETGRTGGIMEVPVAAIATNPRQPRRRFSELALEDLAESIRQCGILQPLVVRNTERGYELIAGERRLRAARRAGLDKVPVVVRQSSDRDQLEVALIENLQREDLSPIEEAQGYERLIAEFSLTQEEISARVGKERSTVSNMLRLLKLAPVVQEMLSGGALSMGHARAILSVEDPRRQEELAHKIEKEGLSVRQVESLVRVMTSNRTKNKRRVLDQVEQNPNLRHIADELQRILGTRVEVQTRGRGGEIRIQFYTTEDFKRLSDRLLSL